MAINFQNLEYFEVSAHLGSYRAAAEQLFRSYQGIYQGVHQLENDKVSPVMPPAAVGQHIHQAFRIRMNSSPVMVSFSSRYFASSCSLSMFSWRILSAFARAAPTIATT